MEKLWPKVGICVWVMDRDGRALMMLRQGSSGAGSWACPGGKLEMAEEILDCAIRETKEEVDIRFKRFEYIGVTNDISDADNHWLTVHVKALEWAGNAKIGEPQKCSQIGWYGIHNLPTPLFLPQQNLLKSDIQCLCGSGKSFKDCHVL